jgi:hypothetical protein
MEFIFWIFVIVIVGTLIAGQVQANAINAKKKLIESRLQSLPDFSPTQLVVDCDATSGVGVDEDRKVICLISNSVGCISERLISYRDIFSVELFEDGASITKTVRSSQIGGAVVGGLFLGGVGAIIGGLTGKTETSGKIRQVALRLIVNDTNSPLHDIVFMNFECTKASVIYTKAIALARRWHGIIEVLIKRSDADEKAAQFQAPPAPLASSAVSVADEIKKLAELHHAGVLTLAEFSQEKNRLLTGGQTTQLDQTDKENRKTTELNDDHDFNALVIRFSGYPCKKLEQMRSFMISHPQQTEAYEKSYEALVQALARCKDYTRQEEI